MKIKKDAKTVEADLQQVHNQKTDEVIPAVRYFQIHFEFMEEQLTETKATLMALQSQMKRLEIQLAAMPCSSTDRNANPAGKRPNRPMPIGCQLNLTSPGSQ